MFVAGSSVKRFLDENKTSPIVSVWKKYKILLVALQKVFQFLDRYYLLNVDDEHGNLNTVGITIFKQNFYNQDDTVDALTELLDHARLNIINDTPSNDEDIMLLFELLVAVNCIDIKITKKHTISFKSINILFENDILRDINRSMQTFYSIQVKQWISEKPCIDALHIIQNLFEFEESHIVYHLYNEHKFINIYLSSLQKSIITNHAEAIINLPSSCTLFFSNPDQYVEQIQLLYQLFSKSYEEGSDSVALTYLADKLTKCIEEEVAHFMNSAGQNPKQVIDGLMDLNKKSTLWVESCFNQDQKFCRARELGMRLAMNKIQKLPAVMALYCDHLLKVVFKNASDDDMKVDLERILALLVLVENKDVFFEAYRVSLGRRLLKQEIVSFDVETSVVDQLRYAFFIR